SAVTSPDSLLFARTKILRAGSPGGPRTAAPTSLFKRARLFTHHSSLPAPVSELIDAQTFDAELESRCRHAEPDCGPGRPRHAPSRRAERAFDHLSLLRLELRIQISPHRTPGQQRISLDPESSVARCYDGSLDGVFEFAHITRPVIRRQQAHRATIDPDDGP